MTDLREPSPTRHWCMVARMLAWAGLTTTIAPTSPLPAARRRQKPRANEPRFDLRAPLHQLSGVDLSQIDGIGPCHALRLPSEIGTDMSRWPTEKHFTSWLTLAPHNQVSGGRLLSSRIQPSPTGRQPSSDSPP
jgi:hypothetical protein